MTARADRSSNNERRAGRHTHAQTNKQRHLDQCVVVENLLVEIHLWFRKRGAATSMNIIANVLRCKILVCLFSLNKIHYHSVTGSGRDVWRNLVDISTDDRYTLQINAHMTLMQKNVAHVCLKCSRNSIRVKTLIETSWNMNNSLL